MTWSFVNRAGFFSGRVYSGPEAALEANTPSGFFAVPGVFNQDRECWDFPLSLTVEFFPLRPPETEMETFEWDEEAWSWVPVPTLAAKAAKVRAKRDARMRDCDWVTLRAFRTGSKIPEEWATYMQALADVPDQPGFPEDILWPTQPA